MDKLFRKKRYIVLFLAPAFILFTAVLIVPIGTAFYYSLCEYRLNSAPEFVGLRNYITIFTDDADMKTAFKNSAALSRLFSVTSPLNCGMKAAEITPSAKSRRMTLGIMKATANASAKTPVPKKAAVTDSRTKPKMREIIVRIARSELFLNMDGVF